MNYKQLFIALSRAREVIPLTSTFWIVMVVIILFLGVILTAANNDDQTKGV
jgi:hypothetical protein